MFLLEESKLKWLRIIWTSESTERLMGQTSLMRQSRGHGY